MVDEGAGVGELPAVDQRESVEFEVRARAALEHVDVVAREARPERHGEVRIRAVAGDARRGRREVIGLLAVALELHVAHAGVRTDVDLDDGIHAVRAIVRRDVILEDRDRRAVLGDDEHARLLHDIRLRADEQAMDRLRGDGIARRVDEHAIGEPCGVRRDERVVLEAGDLAEARREHRVVGREGIGEPFDPDTVDGDDRRQRHREMSVDEHEPRRCLRHGPLGDGGCLECRTSRRLTERHAGQRCQVGEAPFLVPRRGHGQRVRTFEGAGTQCLQGVTARRGTGQQAVEEGPRAGSRLCHQAASRPIQS